MTPETFIKKWRAVELKEKSAAQSHFIDLCKVLSELAPTDADPIGDWYCFEKGATKSDGSDGWADVWKKGHFGWEYKGKKKDLNIAFSQLQQYALALENPPLLIVCDMDKFRIHTNWTNTVSQVHEFGLDELADASNRQKLKWAFSDPEKLRPIKTRKALTEQAAAEFATLAQNLRDRGHNSEEVAHFINRLIFCMFAEDVDLLPKKLFQKLLLDAGQFQQRASELFKAMKGGGNAGWEKIEWFNGGLFDDDKALPLLKDDVELVARVAALDWAEIDPSILGTLFERGLDPDKRSQFGAHYTDRDKIALIIEAVIERPWLAEWANVKSGLAAILDKKKTTKSPAAKTKIHSSAETAYKAFLDRLRMFTVLDPACGSGNFLNLALLCLKDIEHRVSIEAEELGLQREFPVIGPAAVKGVEINSYAAELARVSIWIGEIQWMRRNGFDVSKNPILKPLHNIECRDAVLTAAGTEADWPVADVVVGNPPFLGDRQHKSKLGDHYTETLRSAYAGRVRGRADLVVYWFQKAAEKLANGQLRAFGLVGTKSIAKGASRVPLDALAGAGKQLIYDAWTNEPWVVEGAAVRVSIVCAGNQSTLTLLNNQRKLNGSQVTAINPDLTSGIDITVAHQLLENTGIAFQGVKLTGPFDINGQEARRMLQLPLNPNNKPNTDVIARLYDIDDVVGRDSDRWVVDFGTSLTATEAALFQEPYKIIANRVVPFRNDPNQCRSNEARLQNRFWEFQRPRPEMRQAISGLSRVILTPESSEHRVFVFAPAKILPQGSLFIFAREDDMFFGILSSRIHEVWATAQGNRLGAGNQRRYNATVTFQTFPFPSGLTPDLDPKSYAADPRAMAIATAARNLVQLRDNWLNPANLVTNTPEVVSGYPNRILPINNSAAETLKKRTLTDLYNENPTWLVNAHRALDTEVETAYGWPANLTDDDILARLITLNQQRQPL